jgi:hypothetical protein
MTKKIIIAEQPSAAADIARDRNHERTSAR